MENGGIGRAGVECPDSKLLCMSLLNISYSDHSISNISIDLIFRAKGCDIFHLSRLQSYGVFRF